MLRIVLWSGITLMLALGLSVQAGEPVTNAPGIPADLPEGWYARIVTTMGTIIAELLPDQAPQSVAHFAGFAEGTLAWNDLVTGEPQKGRYYDGNLVYLAEAGQRFEAGDIAGTGRNAPEVFVKIEGKGPVSFNQPGRLGMTRGRGGRISAVQFFVTASALPWLTGRHPCFGKIVSGREVVLAISEVRTYSNGRPLEPITIESIRIFSSGSPDPIPEPVPFTPSLRPARPRDDGTKNSR